MPTILVVDDSPIDRRIVTGLLKGEEDWTIDQVNDGEEALRYLEKSHVDLAISDLMMPGIDGLQLVKEVKSNYPLVPIILMTSKGNEEIAVQALQSGAASYVPKSTLARTLVDTVRSVLSVSGQMRDEARLIKCLKGSEYSFELDNDSSLIPALIGFLQDDTARIGLCDEAERVRVGVALDEALVNALYHGNLEVSSDLRDTDYEAYRELVQQRKAADPYRTRRIHVDVRMSPQQAEFTIRDEGPGFDPGNLPDPTDPANLENLGGRGVLLMRTFMDNVAYNETGNAVTLVKLPSRGKQHEEGTGNGNG